MADDAPTRARSSVLNPNKSQTARGKQVNNASTRSKVVTRPRTLLLSFCPPSAERLILCAPQPGRKTSPRRPRTLISNSLHLWAARMACPMRVVRTCRKTPPRGRAANNVGSRSLAAGQRCYHRKCSVPSLLWRGGPPSSGLPTGRIAVQHWVRRALNKHLRARQIGACA